jgi:hypothetical protein
MWNASEHTDEENVRWCWLRATEWAVWPLFVAQPIVPVLLLFWSWPKVVLALSVSALLWKLVRYRFVSAKLAYFGVLATLPKWPIGIAVAVYLVAHAQYANAAVSACWPLLTLMLMPVLQLIPPIPTQVGILQGRFMQALGLGGVWGQRRQAREEVLLQSPSNLIGSDEPDRSEQQRDATAPTNWDELLRDVDFEAAKNAVSYVLAMGEKEAAQQGGEYVYKKELADVLTLFLSDPCATTAVQLLEVAPFFCEAFEASKPGGLWTR